MGKINKISHIKGNQAIQKAVIKKQEPQNYYILTSQLKNADRHLSNQEQSILSFIKFLKILSISFSISSCFNLVPNPKCSILICLYSDIYSQNWSIKSTIRLDISSHIYVFTHDKIRARQSQMARAQDKYILNYWRANLFHSRPSILTLNPVWLIYVYATALGNLTICFRCVLIKLNIKSPIQIYLRNHKKITYQHYRGQSISKYKMGQLDSLQKQISSSFPCILHYFFISWINMDQFPTPMPPQNQQTPLQSLELSCSQYQNAHSLKGFERVREKENNKQTISYGQSYQIGQSPIIAWINKQIDVNVEYAEQLIQGIMKFLQSNHDELSTKEEEQFRYIYSSSSPSTLVLLRSLEKMPFYLIKNSKETRFFCLDSHFTFKQSLIYQVYLRFGEKLKKITKFSEITVVKTIQDLVEYEKLREESKGNQNFVVFTCNQITQNDISQITATFYVLEKSRLSRSLLQVSNKIYHTESGEQLIAKLRQHILEKQLPNFLFYTAEERETSNRLVRVIYSMLNQPIGTEVKTKILSQLGKLILLLAEKSQFYYTYEESVQSFLADIKEGRNVIKWYTAESSIYKVLNNLLRSTRHPAQIFYLQPFFKSLYQEIKRIFKQKIEKQGRKNFKCFRGIWMAQEQIQMLKDNIGKTILNLGFTSTTLTPKNAQKFGNCFLEIIVEEEAIDEGRYSGYANIEQYSCHPNQRQVLFNPLNTFTILQVGDHPTMQKMIRLQYKQEIKLEEKENQNDFLAGLQGHTLIERTRILDGAKQYWRHFEIILKQYISNRSTKINDSLFLRFVVSSWRTSSWSTLMVLSKNWEFDQYIRKSKMKLKILALLSKVADVQFGVIGMLENLGNAFLQKDDYQNAIRVQQRARQMYKSKYGSQRLYYSKILTTVGKTYFYMHEYEKALENCNQALQIRETRKADNTELQYAQLLQTLAKIYTFFKEFDRAIQFLEKAIQIIKKRVGMHNPSFVKTVFDLGQSYASKGQYQKAIEKVEAAKDIVFPKQKISEHLKIVKFLGGLYKKSDLLDKAISLYEQTKKKVFNSEWKSSLPYLQILVDLAESYLFIKQQCKSIQLCQTIRNELRKNNQLYLRLVVILGNCYFSIDRYEKAEKQYLSAKDISKSILKDQLNYGVALASLGLVYFKKKQIGKSMIAYLQSEQIFMKKMGVSSLQYMVTALNHSLIYQEIDTNKYVKMLSLCRPKFLRKIYQQGLATQKDCMVSFKLLKLAGQTSLRLAKYYLKKKNYQKSLIYASYSLKENIKGFGLLHTSCKQSLAIIQKIKNIF